MQMNKCSCELNLRKGRATKDPPVGVFMAQEKDEGDLKWYSLVPHNQPSNAAAEG